VGITKDHSPTSAGFLRLRPKWHKHLSATYPGKAQNNSQWDKRGIRATVVLWNPTCLEIGCLFSLAHNPLEKITNTNYGDAVNQRNTTRRKIAGAIVCINRCYNP
jgi:hypothetical protein